MEMLTTPTGGTSLARLKGVTPLTDGPGDEDTIAGDHTEDDGRRAEERADTTGTSFGCADGANTREIRGPIGPICCVIQKR